MKYISKILLAISVVLLAQTAAAQPPKRKKEAAAKQETTVNIPMSERAKAQYPVTHTPTEVVWKRDVYRTLDLKKEKNATLYYPVDPQGDNMNLFTYIFRLFINNDIPAYSYNLDGNESFVPENKVNPKELLDNFGIYYEEENGALIVSQSDIPSAQVLSYYIKESNYYDQRTATYNRRITALCPVLHRSGEFTAEVTKYPMFWLNYDEISPYLGMTPLMTSSYNNVSNMSIDDYFVRSLYEGDIYKTANLQNKLLAQYCPNDTAMKAEQQRIEKELVTFENKLWGIEEPDTTNTTSAKVDKKSVTTRSSARPAVTRVKSESTKAEPVKQESKIEKKPAAKSPSARTARTKTTSSSKPASSSQTLSVRRERR